MEISEQLPPGAVSKESHPHRTIFTTEQLAQKRLDAFDAMNSIDDIKKRIDAFCEPLKAEIKKHSASITENRTHVKDGFVIENRDCWLSPNFETGMMEYCDCETNEKLFERRLSPTEKQKSIDNAAVMKKVV